MGLFPTPKIFLKKSDEVASYQALSLKNRCFFLLKDITVVINFDKSKIKDQ